MALGIWSVSPAGADSEESRGRGQPRRHGRQRVGAAGAEVTGPCGLLQVLDTYMFHSFLKARLSRRMDAFAQMDLDMQSDEDRCSHRCGRGIPGARAPQQRALIWVDE